MAPSGKILPDLTSLAHERDGYHFAHMVTTLNDSTMLPLLRETGTRKYITYTEARIITGKLTGAINHTIQNVFIPCGAEVDVFCQLRHGMLLHPRATVPLRVRPFEWQPARYRILPGQVGAVALNNGQVDWLECFDSPASWHGLCDGAAPAANDHLETQTWAMALSAATAVLRLPYRVRNHFDHRPKGGIGVKVYALTGDTYSGELVEVDGRMIHLQLKRS